MPIQSIKPPIKVSVNIITFNSLIEFITKVENISDILIKEKASKLKDKILRYSIPIVEEEKELIEIRFFPNEAATMIEILLYAVDGIKPDTNYYNILLDVREKNKKLFKDKE